MNKFIKAQVSSLAATVVDFSITIFLKEICGLWYLTGTITGTVLGGVTNFILNRRWVFCVTFLPPWRQAIRYSLVWGGSILLNICVVFLLTSFGHMNYLLSKIITATIIGISFNYLLQKYFVFNSTRENL